ncbi:MAG TPA: DoxX family protein, partial [Thermoanaerobaculia bacterium]
MEQRGRLIPMFRRTAAQPLDDDSAIDSAPSPDSSAAEDARGSQAATEWGPVKRLLFRFACVYLVLYSFPFPLDYMPYIDVFVVLPYQKLQDAVVLWTGKHVFLTDVEIFRPNGSGDSTYDYVLAFSFLVFSVAATLVWTLLDRKRRNYERLHEWLRIYVRFVLATAMISYGAYKVIPSQFPAPSLDRLMQPFGDASPMGLLWTFIGASTAYNIFGGVGEMLGGLLLTFRR